jgi:hypothetical protein
VAFCAGDTHHWGGPPDGTETEADWKAFWTGLFKLAKDRAIDPYVVDWNIFLSEGYKNGYDSKAITDHDGSGGKGTANPQADRYQREVITQVTKKVLSLHFLQLKRIILPRQARDKRREFSKRDVYSYRLLTSMRILLVSESRSASGAMHENTLLRFSAFHDASVLSLSWQIVVCQAATSRACLGKPTVFQADTMCRFCYAGWKTSARAQRISPHSSTGALHTPCYVGTDRVVLNLKTQRRQNLAKTGSARRLINSNGC